MGTPSSHTRAKLEELATTVLGSPEAAKAWLFEPRDEFQGIAASELINTDIGCGRVAMELQRIENQKFARKSGISFKS